MLPALRFDTPPAPQWRWRASGGAMLLPSEMVTAHLFHTLRMIWNNTMPAYARVGAVKLYSFSPRYDRRYMTDAIGHLGNELFRRDDLVPQLQAELEQMAAFFANRLEAGHPAREHRA
jgi:hypothetical protein